MLLAGGFFLVRFALAWEKYVSCHVLHASWIVRLLIFLFLRALPLCKRYRDSPVITYYAILGMMLVVCMLVYGSVCELLGRNVNNIWKIRDAC